MSLTTIAIFSFIIFILINICSIPFYLMLNFYFFKKNKKTIVYSSIVANLFFLIIYIISAMIDAEFFISFKRILNYYIGFILYMLIIGLGFWIIYFILKIFKKDNLIKTQKIGLLFVVSFLSINIVAIYNFEKGITVEQFTINTSKVSKNYKIVHISDIQFGTVSKEYMNNVMKIAQQQNPDFMVFTGDLIDFKHYKEKDFDYFKSINVPIFFERGNHEFYHYPEKILSYLQKTQPFVTLINSKAYFDEIEIVGIDFNDRSNIKLMDGLANIELDKDKFSILLYHAPKDVEKATKKGFDLMLFGHTHGGQIWPINYITKMIYGKYAAGLHKIGTTKTYTTNGAALFGPKMRLGSQNEIAVFNIKTTNN